MLFLATLEADPGSTLLQGGGVPWWQTAGGLLLVFGLLVVCLKLLGRFQRRSTEGRASILAVWNLGPRREIQVLRLGDEAHTIYRHDGAMVLLKQEPLAAWEAGAGANPPVRAAALPGFLGRLLHGSDGGGVRTTCGDER